MIIYQNTPSGRELELLNCGKTLKVRRRNYAIFRGFAREQKYFAADIAKASCWPRSAVNTSLSQLRKRGLIESESHEGREQHWSLSAMGCNLLARFENVTLPLSFNARQATSVAPQEPSISAGLSTVLDEETYKTLTPIGYMATSEVKCHFSERASEVLARLVVPASWRFYRCWLDGKEALSPVEFFACACWDAEASEQKAA